VIGCHPPKEIPSPGPLWAWSQGTPFSRPLKAAPAFLPQAFAAAQFAQCDWGKAWTWLAGG